jgi:hypothetical protein
MLGKRTGVGADSDQVWQKGVTGDSIDLGRLFLACRDQALQGGHLLCLQLPGCRVPAASTPQPLSICHCVLLSFTGSGRSFAGELGGIILL